MDLPMKPSMYVSSKDLPQIKDWKVGEKYEIVVTVTLASLTDYKSYMDSRMTIEEMKIPEVDDQDVKTMDNTQFGAYSSQMKRKEHEKAV